MQIRRILSFLTNYWIEQFNHKSLRIHDSAIYLCYSFPINRPSRKISRSSFTPYAYIKQRAISEKSRMCEFVRRIVSFLFLIFRIFIAKMHSSLEQSKFSFFFTNIIIKSNNPHNCRL